MSSPASGCAVRLSIRFSYIVLIDHMSTGVLLQERMKFLLGYHLESTSF